MAHINSFDAVIFDIGNTLVAQNNPGVPIDDLVVEPLPGVFELLESLHGKKRLALVSNSKSLTSKDLLDKLEEVGLAKYFEFCISSLDIGVEKPSPLPLLAAVEKLGVQPSRALYIGDIESDFESAVGAGLSFMYTSRNLHASFKQFLNDPHSAFSRGLNTEVKLNEKVGAQVAEGFDGRVKPPKSLGSLETLAAQISRITHLPPKVDPCAVAIFVADHGIAKDDSVTPWPQSITALMADLIIKGEAGISAIAENSDVYVEVINVGTVIESNFAQIKNVRVALGTKDFRVEDAMSEPELCDALEIGALAAERLVAGGSRALCVGEVGIGNTTSSAILIGALCKSNAKEVTGYGSAIPQAIFESKLKIVHAALEAIDKEIDPMRILQSHGGLEIAAMTGFIIRGATLGVPIILDGVITLAAACAAASIKPEILGTLIAGHCSTEPASKIAINKLKLKPILDLDLRLGEGTGAVLCIPILRAACLAYERMGKLENYI